MKAYPLSRPGILPERERGAAALPFHVVCALTYTILKGRVIPTM
jgi:hypothetical protein